MSQTHTTPPNLNPITLNSNQNQHATNTIDTPPPHPQDINESTLNSAIHSLNLGNSNFPRLPHDSNNQCPTKTHTFPDIFIR